jgi:hypothetical protein
MSGAETALKWNYRRRATRAIICLSPVALLGGSLVTAELMPRASAFGLGLAACALFPAVLNVFLSVVRPTVYRWRRGSLDGVRNVSGLPLIGTFFVVLAGFVGFGDWRVAVVGLVVLAFDCGGLPWVLVATWRDHSFWDA